MFRFWSSDSRGSDKTLGSPQPLAELIKPPPLLSDPTVTITPNSTQSLKRSRSPSHGSGDLPLSDAPVKRARLEQPEPSSEWNAPTTSPADKADMVRDGINHQFGLEILLKHNELRLVNQELAKCQTALEQLRRCHLIPYPVSCPTPDRMMDISNGRGPSVQSQPNQPVPRWAPPFGVADGPYARHYAKWLIPDPLFDGIQPEKHSADASRPSAAFAEGRTTRNSFTEGGSGTRGRPSRGSASQKLQALSSGYPAPKDKSGPCVLRRSDGQTVKLVCVDCFRENFSSTQGFINHCRIAHKRDFKSHEEAAVHCGQPLEAAPSVPTVPEDKGPVVLSHTSWVHPFARSDMSEQQALSALRSRLADSLELFRQGKLTGVTDIPTSASSSASAQKEQKDSASSTTPHLSRLLQRRKFQGNLADEVTEAKTKETWEESTTPDEESDEVDSPPSDKEMTEPGSVMRMPLGTKVTHPSSSSTRPTSSKGQPPSSAVATPPNQGEAASVDHPRHRSLSDDDVDMDDANLSPNTLVSNNAPSLVSDDGEYDDSDDGTSMSETSENSVSDVAEITLDDEHDPRGLRRASGGVSGAVQLRKDDAKHVTFISPVENANKDKRSRRR